jgi:hypothetical protein
MTNATATGRTSDAGSGLLIHRIAVALALVPATATATVSA